MSERVIFGDARCVRCQKKESGIIGLGVFFLMPTDLSMYLFSIQSFVDFFFQAEDGIRDHCVTGFQTCALPIFCASSPTDEPMRRYQAYRVSAGPNLPVW